MITILHWVIYALTPPKFLTGKAHEVSSLGLYDIESRTGKLMLGWRKFYGSEVDISMQTPFKQIAKFWANHNKSLTERMLEKVSKEQTDDFYRFCAELYQKFRYQFTFHSTEPAPHQPFETFRKFTESFDFTHQKASLQQIVDNATKVKLNGLEDITEALNYIKNGGNDPVFLHTPFNKMLNVILDPLSARLDCFWASYGIDPNSYKNLSELDIAWHKISTCLGAFDTRWVFNYSEIQNSGIFSNYIENAVCIVKKANHVLDVRNSISNDVISTNLKNITINATHHWTNLVNDTKVFGLNVFQKLHSITSTLDIKTQPMALIDHLKSTSESLDLNSQIELIFELANRVNTTLWTVLPTGIESAPAISSDIVVLASLIIPVKIVASAVTDIIASTTQVNFLTLKLAHIVQDIPIKSVVTNLERIIAAEHLPKFAPFTEPVRPCNLSVPLQYVLKDPPSVGVVLPDSKDFLNNLRGVVKRYDFADIFLSNVASSEFMYKNLSIPGVKSILSGTFQIRFQAFCQLTFVSELITPIKYLEEIRSPEFIKSFNNYMAAIGMGDEVFKNMMDLRNFLVLKKFSVDPVKHAFNLAQGIYPMTYAEDLLYFTTNIGSPYGLEAMCELIGNSHFQAFMNQAGCESYNYKDISLYAKDIVTTLLWKVETHKLIAAVTSNPVERQYNLNCYFEVMNQIMLFDMKYNLNLFYLK